VPPGPWRTRPGRNLGGERIGDGVGDGRLVFGRGEYGREWIRLTPLAAVPKREGQNSSYASGPDATRDDRPGPYHPPRALVKACRRVTPAHAADFTSFSPRFLSGFKRASRRIPIFCAMKAVELAERCRSDDALCGWAVLVI